MNLPLLPVFHADRQSAYQGSLGDDKAPRSGAPSPSPSRLFNTSRIPLVLTMALGLGLAFFALAWLGIAVTREMSRIAAVWLANGVAVAVILRSSRSLAPWLFGATALANLAANLAHADPLLRAVSLSAANLVEIGVVVLLMRPHFDPRTPFDTGPVIGRFMIAAAAGALLAGLVAAGLLAIGEGGSFGSILLHWVPADLLGLLIVATLLLSLPPDAMRWKGAGVAPSLARRVEQWALVSMVIATTALLFLQDEAPLLFLIGPLLVFCAFRLSLAYSSFAILVSSAVAIASTLLGYGPVARFASDPITEILALQSLIASMIALVLPVRALIVERDRLGVAMAQTERKFMRIAEASTAGILHLDLQGLRTWANQRWTELTGETAEDGAREGWMHAVASDERRRLGTLWTEARATLQPVRGEFSASPEAAEQRNYRWVALSIHPERSLDGDLTGFVVRLEDITDRRTAEQALAESERLYRLVTENVSDIVVRLGLDGTMLYVSSAVRRILGFEPEQLVGRPMRDLVHGEDWADYKAAFADILTLERASPDLRYRQRCADGSFLWVEGKFSPVFDQPSGRPVELIASIRDISRRHRTEQVIIESAAKLRESNRLVSMAEDLAQVGHWRFDLVEPGFDYSIQVNTIIGVSRRDSLSARDALRMVEAKDRGTLLATVARARRAERPCECEVALTTPVGHERILRVVIQADRSHGGRLTGIFGVVRDVTVERHATEELVRARDRAHSAANAKANFLATMSHEIRTPMTGVLGMIDLLMKQPDDVDRTRYLDMLKTSADLLMAVLDDILDFSKIDSGQVLLEKREFAADRLIEECTALFERRACEKGLRLLFDYDGPTLPVVGDANRLRQVLANLLSNAVKFTPAGDIVVRLEATPGATTTGLSIEVVDHGIGIAADQHARLFDPFVQADASTSREYGGTGLGLAICRRLVEAMGGKISVDSREGEGATFRIDLDLPTGSPSAAAVAPTHRQAASDRRPQAGLSILVAEDNPVNQMLIGAMLRADGHKVTAVENGRLAVDLAQDQAFDVIIMDMQMPVMDGLAATRAIRGSEGPCASIPILALTADASPERRRFYDGAGLSAFLTKPIDQDLLLDHLRSIASLGDAVDHAPAVPDLPDVPEERASENKPPREPLMDDRHLAALRAAVGDVRIEQMFDLLDLELQQRPADIATAIEQGDEEAARRIAHSLKGAAGSAGALAVAAQAARLEEKGAPLHEIVADLLDASRRTRQAISVLSDRTSDRAAHG